MNKYLLAVLLLCLSVGNALAECYPAASGVNTSTSPDCVTVQAIIDPSGKAAVVSAANPIPVTGAGLAVVGLGQAAMAASVPVTMASDQTTITVSMAGGDVCQNPSIAKLSTALTISTATTTSIVAAVGGKIVYVCSINFTTGGTLPTYKIISGTQAVTPCDTGPADLTGTFAPISGSSFMVNGPGTLVQTAASKQLCIVTAGTLPAANGFLTYVQQ